MPRRKKSVMDATPIGMNNYGYWNEVLIKLGYKLPYLQSTEVFVQQTSTAWELEVIKDPLFEKFLRYGPGRSNIGPKSISEFLELPESDKKFFVQVFNEWKKVIKEKNIPIEKLE